MELRSGLTGASALNSSDVRLRIDDALDDNFGIRGRLLLKAEILRSIVFYDAPQNPQAFRPALVFRGAEFPVFIHFLDAFRCKLFLGHRVVESRYYFDLFSRHALEAEAPSNELILDSADGLSFVVQLQAKLLVRYLTSMPLGRGDAYISSAKLTEIQERFQQFLELNTEQRSPKLRSSTPRSPEFRESVLRAYGNRCAICQLDLGLVEAAHLLPFASDSSNDTVNNGIALCPNHHAAFDSGLILIDEDFKLSLSVERRLALMARSQAQAVDEFELALPARLHLPEDSSLWPSLQLVRLRQLYLLQRKE
jgi:hypothetical protein